jgi:hypothetical protein
VRAVLLLLPFLAACGAGSARGTLARRPYEGDVVRAQYCDHCGGGERVTVTFRGDDGTTVRLVTGECIDEHEQTVGEAGATVTRQPSGAAATSGQLRIVRCSPAAFEARFVAHFADGSELRGDVDTALEVERGYD